MIYHSILENMLLYAAEAWTMLKKNQIQLKCISGGGP